MTQEKTRALAVTPTLTREQIAKYLYTTFGQGDSWDTAPEHKRNYLELDKSTYLSYADQIIKLLLEEKDGS